MRVSGYDYDTIEGLKKRREMAVHQRKITTQILTVWEYDDEIEAIDRKIERLEYKLKNEKREIEDENRMAT